MYVSDTPRRAPLVAICGTSTSNEREDRIAERVGNLCAEYGYTVLCGGRTGVMTSAAKGVTDWGGTAIGFLPDTDPEEGNEYLTYSIPTGLGEMRNGLLANAAVGMVAIGGGYGTLSEIGFGLRLGKPVTCIESWTVQQPHEQTNDEQIHWAADADSAMQWLRSQIKEI